MKPWLAAALLAPAAHAAAMAALPDGHVLEEVMVTARRMAEDAARTPLSIDVISAAELGKGGVEDLASLASRVPGLSFEALWGGQGAAVMMRGLSQPSTAGDNVGVFVDDVYQAGRPVTDVDMLDLDRIEVVRGPQNTLFGRSTFAGAVRFVPAMPTSSPGHRLKVDAGTDGLAGVEGAWSRPIGQSTWGVRAAAALRRSDGAYPFATAGKVGDSHRRALALTIAGSPGSAHVSLHVRLGDLRSGHPASSSLHAEDFNCGARDGTAGYWTYYCGEFPMQAPAAVTLGLPHSRARLGQASLRMERPLGGLMLHYLGSHYRARSSSIRDFDGSTAGFWSGVCDLSLTCNSSAPVIRFAFPNVVSNSRQHVQDWSQELRLSGGASPGTTWMLGMAATWSRTWDAGYFGADRGDLQPDERLTAIVGRDPAITGPLSQLNRALVSDSRKEQLLAAETHLRHRTVAAFGMIEVPVTPRLAGRIELRGEHELLHLDPRVASFLPVQDPRPPAGRFWSVTPRLNLGFQSSPGWYAWASIARGARSGGVNTLPGLDAEERNYKPEYNWTTEAGIRLAGARVLRQAELTAWFVDWRNTQLMGVATTPGINALVTRNTRGIVARGLEARTQLAASRHVRLTLAGSLADTAFRAGSDDPGARQLCGLASLPPASSFCAYGPPRSGSAGPPLVAYLDGNRTSRAPRLSWNAALDTLPVALRAGWLFGAQAQLASQGHVTDRPVAGGWYGRRRLLDAKLVLDRGPWQLALWGTNLTDARYIRAAGSRGAAFYPQLPRPIDLLNGEGRRLGLSVRYEGGAIR